MDPRHVGRRRPCREAPPAPRDLPPAADGALQQVLQGLPRAAPVPAPGRDAAQLQEHAQPLRPRHQRAAGERAERLRRARLRRRDRGGSAPRRRHRVAPDRRGRVRHRPGNPQDGRLEQLRQEPQRHRGCRQQLWRSVPHRDEQG